MFCWISILGGMLIMMEQHSRSEALFYYFRLEDQVPETHLLRNGDVAPITLLPRHFPCLRRTVFPFRRNAWNRAKSRECWRYITGNAGPLQSENDHRKGTA